MNRHIVAVVIGAAAFIPQAISAAAPAASTPGDPVSEFVAWAESQGYAVESPACAVAGDGAITCYAIETSRGDQVRIVTRVLWNGQEDSGVWVERDDVATLLTEARALFSAGGYADAAEQYQRVLDIDPQHVEATTYLAWLLFVGSAGAGSPDVVAAAREALETVIERDPGYADAHCLLAVVAENGQGDTATARVEAQTCLDLDPPGEIEGLVTEFLASLDSVPTPSSA